MKNVADIYPLTPVQAGMLFHTLARGDSARSGTYINQFTCLLAGTLEPGWLKQAWQETIERHPVLRTAVLWDGLDEPLQVVRETVALPWQQMDWRSLPEADRERELAEFLQGDRTRGFDLSCAPLLRLTLARLTDSTYQLVWSSHHLLYDGWSLLLIWQEVLARYAAKANGVLPELAPARPFRDFVAWQQQQPAAATERFWRAQLQELCEPTPLPAARTTSEVSNRPYRQQSQRLSVELSDRLAAFARQNRLTANTLVQGAWALLLSHYSDGISQGERENDDLAPSSNRVHNRVTYGSVVSGRPAELKGVETMVGLFINTLPETVEIDP